MARDNYGNGSLFQRRGTWHVQFYVNGRRYQRSARTDERGEGAAVPAGRNGEGQGRPGGGPRTARLADLWAGLEADYLLNGRRSLRRARKAWEHVTHYFGNPRAAAVDAAELAHYCAERTADGAKPATIKYELATLRRAFRLGARVGLIGHVPVVPTIAPDNARKVFFTRPEFLAVRARLPEVVADVVTFAYYTGWRKGEILTLEWRHIDQAAGVVRVEHTKNREAREFPFAAVPELAAMLARRRGLAELLETGGEAVPFVFHRQGQPIKDFADAWRRACREAGLEGRRILHDFRRTATRNLVRAGVSRDVARKLTGHKTDSIFTRYNITDDRDLREAAGRLAAYDEVLAKEPI